MSAAVTFGSEGYAVEDGQSFPIGAYIHTDGGVGTYYVTINYDPAVLTYVSGADSVDAQNGVLTLSGNSGNPEIKYWLTFQAKQGGDTAISVSSASVNLPDDSGAYEVAVMGAAPVHVQGDGAEENEVAEEDGEEAEEENTTAPVDLFTTAGLLREEARAEQELHTPEYPPDLLYIGGEDQTGENQPGENQIEENQTGGTHGIDLSSPGATDGNTADISLISGEIGTESTTIAENGTDRPKTSIFFNSYVVLFLGLIAIIVAVNAVVFTIVRILRKRKERKKRKPEDEVHTTYDEDSDLEFLHFDDEPEDEQTEEIEAAGQSEEETEGAEAADRSEEGTEEPEATGQSGTEAAESETVDISGAAGEVARAGTSQEAFPSLRKLLDITNPPAVDVRDVTMMFKLSSGEASGFKEFLIHLLKRQIRYRRLYALYHVSFSIQRGEVVGIIGTNGSGKSTLLKIISGALKPTEGEVRVDRRKLQLLTLGTGFDMELTAHENVYLNGSIIGYTREFLDTHYEEIVSFAELSGFMEEKVKNFSSGMVSRLGFAIATAGRAADILILDEVLSVGDEFFRKKSLARISEMIHGGSTVLMVSHGMDTILNHCTRTIWIEKGELKMDGAPKEVCAAYREYGKHNKAE